MYHGGSHHTTHHKVVYYNDKRRVTAYPWLAVSRSDDHLSDSSRSTKLPINSSTVTSVLDLEFFSWHGDEAIEHEKAEQERRKKFAPCLQLLKCISNLPSISEENLKIMMEDNSDDVEQTLLNNELIEYCTEEQHTVTMTDDSTTNTTTTNGRSSLVNTVLVNDKFVDQFIDFIVDEWRDPTVSELVYMLIILTFNNRCLHHLIKRRHVIRICYFVLGFENKMDSSVYRVFQQFLENYKTLSMNILCTILQDELRKFKDFKKNSYNFGIEIRCLTLLRTLRVKYPSESFDSSLQSVLVYLLNLGSNQVSKIICSQAILALKEMKAKSKASFDSVKKAFDSKLVTIKITGTLLDYCKETNTEQYLESLSKNQVDDKKYTTTTTLDKIDDVSDFIQDIQVDPNIYSVSMMNNHMERTILKQSSSSPYNHSHFIKRCYGSLHHQELEQEKEFEHLAKSIIRFRNYGTHKMVKITNKMMYDNIDTTDLKDFSTQTFKRNLSVDYFNYLTSDLAPIIEYLYREKMSLGCEAMYILGVCCEYRGMVVEKFSHDSWSIKPCFAYLVDYGLFERIEEIISQYLKGPSRESENDRAIRLQYICESIHLASVLFNSMKNNGELSRVSFILDSSKFFEYLIYCLYEFRDEEFLLKTIEPCFAFAAECTFQMSMCLIYEKYLLAQISQMFKYAILLPLDSSSGASSSASNSGKISLTTAMTVILRTLYDIAKPTLSKSNGSQLQKYQRRLLAPIVDCGIFSTLSSFLVEKQDMLTGFLTSAMSDDKDTRYHWIAELFTIMFYYSIYPPIRKCFYENDYEIVKILLTKVIFPLNEIFKRKSMNLNKRLHFPNVSGSLFLNGLSLVNRLLWDRGTRNYMISNEKNRSSMMDATTTEPQTKLEDLCFYWINYFVQRCVKNSNPLTPSDLLVWGRSYFLLSSLMIEADFREYLVTTTNIVNLLMDTISIKPRKLTTDIKSSSCKCLMILLKEPKAAERMEADKILKFINSEFKQETYTRLIIPENEIETNILVGLLYDIFDSSIGEEAKQLIKTKYPLLAPQLKETVQPLEHRCNTCKKSSSESSLKRCSACNVIRYCSVECQKKDWKIHKEQCKKIQEESSRESPTPVLEKVHSADKLKTKGNDAYKEGDYKRAINYYARALNQQDAEGIKHILNLNIAQSYFMIQEYEESLNYADLALATDPTYIKAIHRKAACLKMLNRTSEALLMANKGLLLSPTEKQLQDLVTSLK